MRYLRILLLFLPLCGCRHFDSSPKGAANESGSAALAGFAWSADALPACFSARFGKSVYVFDQQRDLLCDNTSSTWK